MKTIWRIQLIIFEITPLHLRLESSDVRTTNRPQMAASVRQSVNDDEWMNKRVGEE